jgi:hypothetical protein
MDSQSDSLPLYDDVCLFLANRDMPLLPARPPLHLVAQDALNDADDKEGWHRGRTVRTRGLCLFEEHVMYTVERTPRWGGFGGMVGLYKLNSVTHSLKAPGDPTLEPYV